jgi:hypothetical protein
MPIAQLPIAASRPTNREHADADAFARGGPGTPWTVDPLLAD